MGVMIVYKKMNEHTRTIEEFLHDFEKRTAVKLDEVDPDTRQGADICNVYDVVEYPTIIATAEDGRIINTWRGLPLPTIDEVNYYVR